MAAPDPDSVSWLRIAAAFVTLFGMLAGFGFIMKYISLRGLRMPGLAPSARRLRLTESLSLDVRRRLVIVRCDETEHLLLLGPERDIVVARGVEKNQAVAAATKCETDTQA